MDLSNGSVCFELVFVFVYFITGEEYDTLINTVLVLIFVFVFTVFYL